MITTKENLPKNHNYFIPTDSEGKVCPDYLINLKASPDETEDNWSVENVTCIFFNTNNNFNFHPVKLKYFKELNLNDLMAYKVDGTTPEDVLVFKGKLLNIKNYKSKYGL